MATGTEFDQMTLDEITEWKLLRKERIREIQAEIDAAQPYYKEKVLRLHVGEMEEQIKAAAEQSGRTPDDQAMFWLLNGDDGQQKHGRNWMKLKEGTLYADAK
jgi:hypothetical protein